MTDVCEHKSYYQHHIISLSSYLWLSSSVEVLTFTIFSLTGSPYRFHYYFPNDTSQSGRDGEDGGRVVQVVDISREDPHIRGTRDNDFRLKDRDALGRLQQGGLDRATRQLASTTNQVEMLLVLDKAAYDRFLTNAGGDAASAQQEIGRYFAGLVKEVNERYATVDTGGFSLRIILTRIITLTTTAESSVTESLVNNGVVNTDDTLDNFRILDNDVLKAGNPHDYAVLVTGLGALHDGQSNNCNSRFFVMAPSASVPSSRSLATNPFTFTSCSLNEIRSFLAGSATNCLRSRQTAPGSEVDIVAMTTVELGQQYNADTQCRQAFGSRSRFCRTRYTSGGGVTFDDMCYNLRCGVPGSTFCGSTLPFDGTTCGDNKVNDTHCPCLC
ncbi:hypothetical protein BaRGS_00034884 [Batillaria attramentaria]|uniref:Peptidase M12B domain-containing protein n=1 Tax=Batillaria attramentaria TaxID=370345 RepID=A0ABD0JGH1_9CAEN